jgi:hypothetical protein
VARNTGRGSRIGSAEERRGRFTEAKRKGGSFGRRLPWWKRLIAKEAHRGWPE